MDDILVIATGNRNKLKEIREALRGRPLTALSLADFSPMPVPVEDGATFAENARGKALHYAKLLGLPCLADDTGLVVDALHGQPGLQTARYAGPEATGWDNCEKLLKEMAGREHRTASFFCALALGAPDGRVMTWAGRCDGEILTERRGDAGFGYDPLFFCPAFGRTYAELSAEEMARISHRGRALADFTAALPMVIAWMRQRRVAGSWHCAACGQD